MNGIALCTQDAKKGSEGCYRWVSRHTLHPPPPPPPHVWFFSSCFLYLYGCVRRLRTSARHMARQANLEELLRYSERILRDEAMRGRWEEEGLIHQGLRGHAVAHLKAAIINSEVVEIWEDCRWWGHSVLEERNVIALRFYRGFENAVGRLRLREKWTKRALLVAVAMKWRLPLCPLHAANRCAALRIRNLIVHK